MPTKFTSFRAVGCGWGASPEEDAVQASWVKNHTQRCDDVSRTAIDPWYRDIDQGARLTLLCPRGHGIEDVRGRRQGPWDVDATKTGTWRVEPDKTHKGPVTMRVSEPHNHPGYDSNSSGLRVEFICPKCPYHGNYTMVRLLQIYWAALQLGQRNISLPD